ncbi:hypothetical protein ACKVWC_011429 [Pyricularia oryzae]
MWDYEIDPSGDTTLILRKPDAPFAAESSAAAVANSSALPDKLKSEKKAAKKAAKEKKARLNQQVDVLVWGVDEPSADVEPEPGITSATAEDGSFGTAETPKHPHLADSQPKNANELDSPTHQKEVRFRLSSKHMILASPYFKTMLGGPWREADELEVEAEDWDTEALLILMRVIHGQNQHVPRLIKLELLAKIAVLVDYYQCRDAIDLAAEIWIQQLTPPEEPSKNLVFWLLISSVFRREEIFRAMTTIALRQSQGPLRAFNLPIPESILKLIDCLSREFICDIVTSLKELCAELLHDKAGCSFACSSMLLGVLSKEMHAKGLELQPGSQLTGISFVWTIEAALQIQSPSWSHKASGYSSYYEAHSCNIKHMIKEKIVFDNINGFSMADMEKGWHKLKKELMTKDK